MCQSDIGPLGHVAEVGWFRLVIGIRRDLSGMNDGIIGGVVFGPVKRRYWLWEWLAGRCSLS